MNCFYKTARLKKAQYKSTQYFKWYLNIVFDNCKKQITTIKYYIHIGKVCVSQRSLIMLGILNPSFRNNGNVSYPLWNKWTHRYPHGLLQKGGNGRIALFDLNFIPEPYRTAIKIKFGDPVKPFNALEDYYTIDGKAQMFYEAFTFEDNTHLSPKKITLYTINASLLSAIGLLRQARETHRKRLGNSNRKIWDSLNSDVNSFNNVLKEKYNHEHCLPRNKRALERVYNKYLKEGYNSLIDGRNKNQNAVTQTQKLR